MVIRVGGTGDEICIYDIVLQNVVDGDVSPPSPTIVAVNRSLKKRQRSRVRMTDTPQTFIGNIPLDGRKIRTVSIKYD